MPAHTAVDTVLQQLQRQPHTPAINNPYLLPHRSENLQAYLNLLLSRSGRRLLLVGEAPGYRGCLQTGIPFSSPRLLLQAPHPFLRSLRPRLTLQHDCAEATASIVWEFLARRQIVPLCWNAYPFHPHQTGQPESNRAPTATEVKTGQAYLQAMGRLWQPEQVAGIGNKGYDAARKAFPSLAVVKIRHPSYGGKADFLTGMRRLYR